MVRLGDVCDILNGYAFQSVKYATNGIRVIRITNVQKGKIVDNDPKFYPISQTEDILKFMLSKNDILLSLTGNVGRVGLLPMELLPAALNQRVACIRLKNNIELFDKYLYWFLNQNFFENECINSAQGLAQKNMSTEWLGNFRIPLPPLDIQQKIAQILDKASSLIEKRKVQLEKLDLLIKSRFMEMFGDPVTNPKGWEIVRLDSIGELNRGISKHRPRNDPKLLGGKYPLIQTGDIAKAGLILNKYKSTYSELGLNQSKLWPEGTLCITIAANIAKTSILGFNACFPDSVVGFIPFANTNKIFIYYWFSFFQKILEEQAPESAQKNINLKILSELPVILPPLPLQTEFASFVERVETEKVKLQRGLENLELNYKSLMQKCFNGELFS